MTLRALLAVALIAACAAAGDSPRAEGPFPADDGTITALVELALWREAALAGAQITVHTMDGVVTLGGFAGSLEALAAASRLARDVPGVHSVRNGIRAANRDWRA